MRLLLTDIDKQRVLLSRLDVSLAIWDRNFQNINRYVVEILVRILKTFFFCVSSVLSLKFHVSLLLSKHAEPDRAIFSSVAYAGARMQR